MNAITRINHIGIRVSDFETARDFYAKLGFEYVDGPIGPEPVAIVEHPCGININFILNAKEGADNNILMDVATKYAGYTHVALEVDNAGAVISELAQHGVELSGDMQHPTGRSIFIRDPDKNVIEFFQPEA